MIDEYNAKMSAALALRKAGKFREAATAYRVAAEYNVDDPTPLLSRATCLRDANLVDRTLSAYRELVQRHPRYAPGWSLYGVYLKNLKRFEEAVKALRTSLELAEDIDTRNTLVVSLFQSGREEQAIAEGTRNLIAKDVRALDRFKSSRWAGTSLGKPRNAFSHRTSQRNVISFSLWGDNPVYVHGAIINARIAPHMFTGWVTRFYVDGSVPADAVKELRRCGAQIVELNDPVYQTFRPMWRFLASDDPNVDWFICRDADSRLNPQELLAVEDWLSSGASFHVMRDHIYHMELILAGMWGAAAGVLPNIESHLRAETKYHNNRFADQAFLADEVWPLARQSLCSHDTYYRFQGARAFPEAYRLPRPIHVGGSVKAMPHWRRGDV